MRLVDCPKGDVDLRLVNCPNCDIKLINKTKKVEGKERIFQTCPTCVFFTMANEMVIEKIYAYVSVDEEKNEGIICVKGPDGSPLPLVGADMDRMNSFEFPVIELVERVGIEVNLLEFSTRKLLKKIKAQEKY